MFDPTIFDNLKVVMEGAVYDRDLEGDWSVIDRKDMVDLATMSRQYSVSFSLRKKQATWCTWFLSSSAQQLMSEITVLDEKLQGCSTWVEFTLLSNNIEDTVKAVYKNVSGIWKNREIRCSLIQTYPLSLKATINVQIKFNRVIREEDIDDLHEMLNYMEDTLHSLNNIDH